MSEFGDILGAFKNMKRDRLGHVSEQQPRGKVPDIAESKDEIIDVINAMRVMNGQNALTEEDIEQQRSEINSTATRISENGINAYAKLVK